MNWYQALKTAQIWNIQSDESFEDELRKLYELEFKYNMLRSYPFTGMEKRRSNILLRLEKEARETIDYVANIIDDVFTQWLAGHAIMDPAQWAAARIEDSEYTEPGETLNSFFGEFRNLTGQGNNYMDPTPTDCYRIIQYFNSNPALFEEFMKFVRQDMIDMEYNNIQGEHYETEEEREAELAERTSFAGEMTIGDWIETYHEGAGNDQDQIIAAIEQISNFIPVDNILSGLYEDVLFPIWMEKWGPEGIEETRDTIENIHASLKTIGNQDIANALSTINIALNASHQTGQMTDYLDAHPDVGDGDVKGLLQELSSMDSESQEWLQELRAIGLQVA